MAVRIIEINSMKKTCAILLFCTFFTQVVAQKQKTISTYLLARYNKTIYDQTLGNNPWGVGLGLHAFLNNQSKFKPAIELTGNIYLEDNKVLRLNPDGSEINDVRGMVNLFAGSSFNPNRKIYFSFVGGISFINGQTSLGIKPSFGFYFSNSQKWTGNISYLNIFNRDKTTKEDFGSLVFSFGYRLF